METEDLSAPIVAMPAEVEPVREVAFIITDGNLGEPFEVYKSANAWWMKVEKVEKLMQAFKNDLSVKEAIFAIGISPDQYKYFLHIHPKFSALKEILYSATSATAKITLNKGLQSDASLALRYLQGTQPEVYRRQVLPEFNPGQGGAYAKKTEELFMDEGGNVVVKRQTAMILEKYGTGNDTDTPEPSA